MLGAMIPVVIILSLLVLLVLTEPATCENDPSAR
jgi:hypothetical protein